jgi:hypothetical protein
MTRKAKKSTSRSGKMPIIGIGVFAVLFVSLLIFAFVRPNAELIVVTAPQKATILLDGKTIKNGARGIRAGKHKIKLSLDGLESKAQEFEISPGETKSVNLFLTGENNDFSYYLQNEEDIELLRLVGDEKANEFISNYQTNKGILELLPISVIRDDGETSSRLERGKDCARSYCLKITDRGDGLKEEMLTKIKSLGFNPDDYEIQYELVD